jgi:hypothetical protein
MLANPSDELDTDNGFSALNIHGSFPSPDDLMNLAPLLSYKLEDENYALIGQSILPIAYIVTTNGEANLPTTSVIDIRPFFRTAELAYNERAGIAAALPSLSLANPAVGKAQLDFETGRVYADLDSRLRLLERGVETTKPRVVSTGYVFGGLNFGVEGAYRDFVDNATGGNLDNAALLQELKTRQGIPGDIIVPTFPDWDIAKWVDEQNITQKGSHPNDYINHVARTHADTVDWGSFSDSTLAAKINKFGTDNNLGQDNFVNILFCKKTVNIDRALVPWMEDYVVHVDLLNCVPLSCRLSGFQSDEAAATQGVWIEKKQDQFTIYCSWVANDYFPQNPQSYEKKLMAGPTGNTFPYNNRDGYWFSGFAVITQDIMNATNTKQHYVGEAGVGVATYPSVTFEVIGIPAAFASHGVSLNTRQPTIKLS